MKKKTNFRWVAKVVIASMLVSIVFTFAAEEVLSRAGYIMAFVILAIFIAIGVLFDIVGVSVTAASQAPFHSMASHKEPGAVEALRLLNNAEKVSSLCNDIVGDISGIVSGTTSAIIVTRIVRDFSTNNVVFQLAISALVAGLTIGGKALGKTLAMNNSTQIVLSVGKVLSIKTKFTRNK